MRYHRQHGVVGPNNETTWSCPLSDQVISRSFITRAVPMYISLVYQVIILIDLISCLTVAIHTCGLAAVTKVGRSLNVV